MIRFGPRDRLLDGGDWHIGLRKVDFPPFFGPEHRHRGFHELLLGLRGRTANTVRGEACDLGAGDLVFVAEHDSHRMQAQDSSWCNIAFSCSLLGWADEALAAGGRITGLAQAARPARVRLPPAQLVELERRLRALSSVAQGGREPRFLVVLLDLLNELALSIPADAQDGPPDWLADLVAAFSALPPEQWSRRRLLAMSGRSSEHLCRSMRAALRSSPTELINRLRLERAASLLRQEAVPVIGIALAAGFASLNHFYVRFRRHFGCAPRDYRRRHRQAL
jgi:AraC-like DNA-binding protein